MLHNKKIIVVLPAYNAEKTLQMTIDAIPKNIVDEIILVDDASRDKTVERAKEIGLKTFVHQKNRGYGGNQKTCYREALHAGADVVVMVHPDFQYHPSYIPELVEPIARGDVDAMFGSRMLIPQHALKGGMPYWKFAANIFLTKLENTILGMNLSEYHSGFRAYSKHLLESLPIELNSDNFVFDTEIITQMRIANFAVREIPIATRYFPDASMIGFFKSLQYGLSILRVMGRYILHTANIRPTPRLKQLITENPAHCTSCGDNRIQLLFPQTTHLARFLENSTYSITEPSSGIHGDIYRCITCNTAFIDHTPIAKALLTHYKNQAIDATYIDTENGRRKTFKRIIKKLRNFASPSKNTAILDIGCGPGFFISEAEKVGYHASGADIASTSVNFAKNIADISQIQTIETLDPQTLFPNTKFNVITAFDFIEHTPNPQHFFETVSAKLKNGGILALTLPIIDSPGAKMFGKNWHALLPSHLTYFSQESFKQIAKKNNFNVLYSRYYLRYLPFSYIIKRIFKRTIPILSSLSFNIPICLFDEIEIYCIKT